MSEIFILRKINHPNIIRFIDMIERIGNGLDLTSKDDSAN
ncbi:unnamed protein product [Brassica oleracea var. botrytis]